MYRKKSFRRRRRVVRRSRSRSRRGFLGRGRRKRSFKYRSSRGGIRL